MATKADLHGSGRIDQALVGRVGAPVRGALLGAEEMIDGGEDIGMRVKMQKADLLTAGQLAAAEANGFRNIPLMEDVDFLMRLNKKKDLKQLNFPIFISSRKWERTNIFIQAIKNWHFRRRWLKGESLKSIYSDYYKK